MFVRLFVWVALEIVDTSKLVCTADDGRTHQIDVPPFSREGYPEFVIYKVHPGETRGKFITVKQVVDVDV
jgi:hypothetical protein